MYLVPTPHNLASPGRLKARILLLIPTSWREKNHPIPGRFPPHKKCVSFFRWPKKPVFQPFFSEKDTQPLKNPIKTSWIWYDDKFDDAYQQNWTTIGPVPSAWHWLRIRTVHIKRLSPLPKEKIWTKQSPNPFISKGLSFNGSIWFRIAVFGNIYCTLPETNLAHENPIFPGKYHQNGGFSMAMLVYRRVDVKNLVVISTPFFHRFVKAGGRKYTGVQNHYIGTVRCQRWS